MGLGDLFFLVVMSIYQTNMGVLSWVNFPGGGGLCKGKNIILLIFRSVCIVSTRQQEGLNFPANHGCNQIQELLMIYGYVLSTVIFPRHNIDLNVI